MYNETLDNFRTLNTTQMKNSEDTITLQLNRFNWC